MTIIPVQRLNRNPMPLHRLNLALLCLLSGSLLISGCAKNSHGTIDVNGTAPVVQSAAISPAGFNVDTLSYAAAGYPIAGQISASIVDQSGPGNFHDASFSIVAPNGNDVVASGPLAVASSTPHTTVSGNFSFNIQRAYVGTFTVHIVSANATGQISTERILPLTISKNAGPPVIGGPSVRMFTPAGSDSTQFTVTVVVTDSNGIRAIRDVHVRALNATNSSPHAMVDDGNTAAGDRFPGDGEFSAIFWAKPTGALQDIILELTASDTRGQQSVPVSKSLRNHPPHITSLNVPSSIPLPPNGQQQRYVFTVTVADSDGLADIDTVYFRNFSSASPSNIQMYDDGDIVAHGDTTANNGVFSRIVVIDYTSATGVRDFRFYAIDKSGAMDVRIYPITIVP